MSVNEWELFLKKYLFCRPMPLRWLCTFVVELTFLAAILLWNTVFREDEEVGLLCYKACCNGKVTFTLL